MSGLQQETSYFATGASSEHGVAIFLYCRYKHLINVNTSEEIMTGNVQVDRLIGYSSLTSGISLTFLFHRRYVCKSFTGSLLEHNANDFRVLASSQKSTVN